MSRSTLPALVLVLAACGSPAPVPDAGVDAGTGPGPWAEEMLAAHNAQRAAAQPAPVPALPPLSWNAAAAATAQAWVNQCRFQHNAGRGNYGENIFASSGTATLAPTTVVDDWCSEKAAYDYATNTCAVGQACGHYTQVVWRGTTSVGCAMAQCTINNPGGGSGAWQFWACDYAPPGNYVGEKPY